jgi:hypothetical protein
MDTHVADEKLKELHVEDATVKANRDALQYEIDPVAEKKLLRKIDLHVVPILWFLFMYVNTLTSLGFQASRGSIQLADLPFLRLAFLDRTNIGMFVDASGDD